MPLNSVRVLDLTRLLPGPYCTMLLADFGAEVIKVEDPRGGDYARAYDPKLDEDSAMFHSLNRNKKSVCLNLKSEEGKAYFLKLVETADVVVESFRPGVMERLGLNYKELKSINPGLVYCAVTGYGQTGPYANRPGHDINYLSYAGLLHLMGEKGGKPIVPATQIADIGGGALPATLGILLALYEREKSDKGQFVDISMLDGVVSWLQTILPNYLADHTPANRGDQTLSGGLAAYEVYETNDERWLSVGALEPKFWKAFCEGIGRSDFIPLLDAPLHEQHRLKYEIQLIISKKSLAEWLLIFSDLEACVSPVLTIEEMIHDPQITEREMIQTVNHEGLGAVKQISTPIKLSETPGKILGQAPKLGEHTEEILKKGRFQGEK
ncbi:crotonobetainyl-CoA:carnitine CoA-transferase CaiB-like acyl-CoA transferase [Virgibacillus natechei]|uniref:Crotonobetainyl-CoA:carnitine CoA-transferase CaiB-like acyl-CoA transferase n=1 Tax=Virgibacillus natechei TaxID=1216297 RepID=A0ABS4IJZ4_9BACI|nr:CoA transferase [Virgibacillus natechei]MBP1971283.1 crotonobetainyl-CoA:carnitine CoA-transferase CaiB-like acyl-CoA transferase [Virgibacillus natechei]UZD12091.1 CoA transferase [Virgibacillus natechei]